MSGDAWKEGGIDATGSLMVITLKVISCAINYNDGLLKEEDLRESQKKNRLLKLPSLIEYIVYCLCCGSHFAGPVYEVKDYLDWTERKGIWEKSEKGTPSPLVHNMFLVCEVYQRNLDDVQPSDPTEDEDEGEDNNRNEGFRAADDEVDRWVRRNRAVEPENEVDEPEIRGDNQYEEEVEEPVNRRRAEPVDRNRRDQERFRCSNDGY
ncbi:uncharacterized protein LOC143623832 [Bidens hawaiensis]|uniref:uncharacterized protein LOC143623832 n=1 Tax=Bidens hawaiensis TaxID=980011 RepID=UPI00404A29AC